LSLRGAIGRVETLASWLDMDISVGCFHCQRAGLSVIRTVTSSEGVSTHSLHILVLLKNEN
ncbi:hypothetical protein, partial [Pseudomonas sp. MD195_PC81_125]|uniref:hypothetical protein n=1 Tax=Pseudomonas sp. MD195_PC81_125 TaxID=2741560 RepID=UPI001C714E18